MTVLSAPAPASPAVAPAERRDRSGPMRRWAWRLFKREWRQQILVLALLIVAVAATLFGTGAATNVPRPAATTISLPGNDPSIPADLDAITARMGPDIVVYRRSLPVPGSVSSIDELSVSPLPGLGTRAVTLLSGHWPAGPDQVALTRGLAAQFGVGLGGTWRDGTQVRQLVGLVRDPNDYFHVFALVGAGQVTSPSEVDVLTDHMPPHGLRLPSGSPIGVSSESSSSRTTQAVLVLVMSTLGLTFIGLVAAAGFAVMAQRRLRALGMLAAVGATDRQIRAAMVGNGMAVGAVGALLGTAVGLAAWFALAPTLANAAGHGIDAWNLPWWAVIGGAVLAFVTAVLAAWWPSRMVLRIPVVAALAARPPRPQPVHRSAALGLGLLGAGVVVMAVTSHATPVFDVVGLLATVAGVMILAPLAVLLAGRLGGRARISARLALRDLARYQSRSGAALSAITLVVILSAVMMITATRQLGVEPTQVPNLPSNQMVVYLTSDGLNGDTVPLSPQNLSIASAAVAAIVHQLGAGAPLELDRAINPNQSGPGNGWGPDNGQPSAALVQVQGPPGGGRGVSISLASTLYVATPALLARYGVTASPGADIITSQPHLPPGTQLAYDGPASLYPNPVVQYSRSLPVNPSGPAALITESAVQRFGLSVVPASYLLETPRPLTTSEIGQAEHTAAVAGLTVEVRHSPHSLQALANDMTYGGIVLALGVLAMTVGLIRAETANDLRTLVAAGASPTSRRWLTAVTAFALALMGSFLGVAGAYIGLVAWFRSSLSTLKFVPYADLSLLLFGLPVLALAGGWLLAGRQPAGLGARPLD